MKARILVVDDVSQWRGIIKRALEKKYEVDTASSLKEALAFLEQHGPYQVVITDIGLSEDETNTDGIDILKFVYEHSPGTKTIAVSGRAAEADRERFKTEYHALDYLKRDVLFKDRNVFIDLVDEGVYLSHISKRED